MRRKLNLSPLDGIFEVSGNNGGDVLRLRKLKDDTIFLYSGHCCVQSIGAIVPVEFLTAIISDVMLKHDNDIYAVIDSFGWSKEFKDELKSKVNNKR